MGAQRLTGKSAVVTGGGNGIGRAVALDLAAEGAKVVVSDIGKDQEGNNTADIVVEEIKKNNGTAIANYDSVATMAGCGNIIHTALDSFGGVDILVNCAGNFIARPIQDLTESEWDLIINTHLKGHYACCQAAVKEMLKQKSGRIINISSRAGFAFLPGPPNSVAYAAAKAGIVGLSAQLSNELLDCGITVNTILPSANTQTFPGRGTRFGGGIRENPDFIAPLIVFLATDAAKDITGRNFYACGGDICIYDRPMQFPGPHTFVRTTDKWTIDELNDIIPPLVGVG
jgi:3-oxoacyl-[acyl-carrier protein] reductase